MSYGFKVPSGGIPQYVHIDFTLPFDSAPQGANAALPVPGQCAFLDRPIFASGQRGALLARTTNNQGNPSFVREIQTDPERRIVSPSPGDGTAACPTVQFLFERWRAKGQLFTVYGYSDGRPNTLVITGFEPNASGPN